MLRKNKRTGPNKERTGEKLDLKKINVHVRLFGSREYLLSDNESHDFEFFKIFQSKGKISS